MLVVRPLVSVWLSHPVQVLAAVKEVCEEVSSLKRRLFPSIHMVPGHSQVRDSNQAVYHGSTQVYSTLCEVLWG